jgi:hypothetical protein
MYVHRFVRSDRRDVPLPNPNGPARPAQAPRRTSRRPPGRTPHG